jgi:hypothetical protein
MSHSIGNHISTQTRLVHSGTIKTQIVQPRTDGPISTGLNGDQAAANAAIRSATAGSTTSTLVDSALTPWAGSGVNAYVGHIVEVFAGTNAGLSRTILSNTNQALTVDVEFPVANDATTRFNIKVPSRSTIVVKGWVFDHTAVAGSLRLESCGLVNGARVIRTILGYTDAAAASIDRLSGFSIVCIPGTDLRTTNVGANLDGTVTMDAYYVHEYTTGVIDD